MMNPTKKASILILFALVILLVFSFKNQDLCANRLSTEVPTIQKEILSKLTGNSAIANGTTLKSRFTENEKLVTRTYLKALFSTGSLQLEEHNYSIKNPYPNRDSSKLLTGTNLYTTLLATTKSDEYIVLGAHYDSVKDCPGANDNASGVALIYGAFKELQRVEQRTKNIIIVFFDAEERGLIGARAFAAMLKQQKYKVHSVHTVDQMGWDKDGDRAIELELPTPILQKAYVKAAQKHDIPVHVTDIKTTDHQAFRLEGFNAIGLTEEYINKDTTPHYHRSTDTYETINFDYLLSTTQVLFCVMKELISN